MIRKEPDIYDEPKVLTFPGMTVRVYKPILTTEERERRMQQIYKAAAALLMSQERTKQAKRTERKMNCERI